MAEFSLSRVVIYLMVIIITHAHWCFAQNQTKAQPVVKIPDKFVSLSQNYAHLLGDVQWFFYRVENIATTLDRMLPNITKEQSQNRTFAETTKLNLLTGIRHLLAGIREISNSFQRSLKTENIQKLTHLQQATEYANDIIKILTSWFANMRKYLVEIVRVYNYYIPEVLLGKCFGRYLVETYPDRLFYEYPFLLISDILETMLESKSQSSEQSFTENASSNLEVDIEQNEIPHSEKEHVFAQSTTNSTNSTVSSSVDDLSFFNLSDVLLDDKDVVIQTAAQKKSWQKCLKLYTTETIMRKLKMYFSGY